MFSTSPEAVEFWGMLDNIAAFAGMLRVEHDRSNPYFCDSMVYFIYFGLDLG